VKIKRKIRAELAHAKKPKTERIINDVKGRNLCAMKTLSGYRYLAKTLTFL